MTLKQLESKISESSIVVAASNQISSDLGGEAVVLNLQSGVYHGLNEVGARIWDLIQQPKSVLDVKQRLLSEYEVEPEVCTLDLLALLHTLEVAGLIEVSNETTT
ncbi:MAG: PqqD family peptide modification chaperone [Rhizonema sp. PD38]|nr:PqqD family peptide modification chaperone [Rhizonema sp. PD38]